MFSRKEKPLPQPVFAAIPQSKINDNVRSSTEGIFLGEDCYWNPTALPNGHVVAIGASGSGKTQTLSDRCYFYPQKISAIRPQSRRSNARHLRTMLC